MRSLEEIKMDVNRLVHSLNESVRYLPTYGKSKDGAWPHIEVKDGCYHFVIVERGVEWERRSSSDYQDLLYWIFESVTHDLAFSYELNNRIEDQDCRRIAFPKQIELMRRIDGQMAARLEAEIAEILDRAPYDDEPIKAVNRMRQEQA